MCVCGRERVFEAEANWSVGMHRHLAKRLIGLLCHKIHRLGSDLEQLHNRPEVQSSNQYCKMDDINQECFKVLFTESEKKQNK